MYKINILFYVLLFFFFSCGSSQFAKDGIFVRDVDEYFNPKQDINVWVYSNFYPYINLDHGLKTNGFFEKDKAVLKQIGFNRRNTKILFSAVPSSEPAYHLIAIQHLKNQEMLKDFEKVQLDSTFYYQKDATMGRLDIRQVYIPYDADKGLSLIYYISTEKHLNCRFCKLDYLAKVNAEELQHRNASILKWQIFDCANQELKLTSIALDQKLIQKHKRTFLKIYADYGMSTGIQYFQILGPKSKPELAIKLCPNQYWIELSDQNERIIFRDSLLVK